MTTEQNKAVCRQVFDDLLVEGKLAAADEVFSSDYLHHLPSSQGPERRGLEAVKEFLSIYRTAFPDLRFAIEHEIAEGDTVVTHWVFRGTHRGDLMGIPPTGKQITVEGATIDRVANGKIVETWDLWDTLGMLQQLGLIPTEEHAAGR